MYANSLLVPVMPKRDTTRKEVSSFFHRLVHGALSDLYADAERASGPSKPSLRWFDSDI